MATKRECYHCHADLFRKATWESWVAPGRRTESRWLCLACGSALHLTFTPDGTVTERHSVATARDSARE